MDEKRFGILMQRFDRALQLLALNLVKGVKGDERVRILSLSGFDITETAKILEMKPNAVKQALHRLRQKGNSLAGFPRSRRPNMKERREKDTSLEENVRGER